MSSRPRLAFRWEPDFIKHVLTTGVMGGLFALCGVSMYAIAIRIATDSWIAVLATLGIAFGTMLWPYSAVFYGHVPAAAFLVLTFALLVTTVRSSPHDSRWQWFWIGLAVAMAFICDFTAASVIPGLAAYGLFALKGKSLKQAVRRSLAHTAGSAHPVDHAPDLQPGGLRQAAGVRLLLRG